MPTPVVLVVFDGLADRPHRRLDGRTVSEAARTPVLDRFTARGTAGLLHAFGPGRAPSSELAHWAMLGYSPEEFPGRAVLEARGHGIPVDSDTVYAFGTLRPSVRRDGARWLTGRATPRQAHLAARLFDVLDRLDPDVRVLPIGVGEAIVSFRGLPSDRIGETDSFDPARWPMLRPQPLQTGPLASAAAHHVEQWTRLALRVLQRRRLNAITLRWFGRPRTVAPFRERYELQGPIVGSAPFLLGLADTVGLDPIEDRDTDDAAADLRRRLDVAARAIDEGATFAVCHSNAPEAAAELNDPVARAAVIERLDRALRRTERAPFDTTVVCVTGDHGTRVAGAPPPSGEGVPIVIAGPGVRRDAVDRFGEGAAAGGHLGRLIGADVMPVLLDVTGRPVLLGAQVARAYAPRAVEAPEPFRE